jgi:hypothetical protein
MGNEYNEKMFSIHTSSIQNSMLMGVLVPSGQEGEELIESLTLCCVLYPLQVYLALIIKKGPVLF